MKIEVTETIYQPQKNYLKLQIKISHATYGIVRCFFHFDMRKDEKIRLKNAFVEGVFLPLDTHKTLIKELKNDQDLIEAVKEIGYGIIAKERNALESEVEVNKFKLAYVSVLSASSVSSKEVKRKGSKLQDVTEENNEKHTVFIKVKIKNLENEAECKVTYQTKKGYKVVLTKSNEDKNLPYHVIDKLANEIVDRVKAKVDFLP